MATTSRRSVLAGIAGSSILMGAKMAFPGLLNTRAVTGKPNILYIMTDQQSWSMMSCYAKSKYYSTPALDSLAAQGVRFDMAYCTNPLCVPSRISLATGLMPSRFGVETNRTSLRSGYSFDGVDLLGKLLTAHGYDARWGGKTHLQLLGENWLSKMGFVEFSDEYNRRHLLATMAAQFLANPPAQPFFLGLSFINPHDICYMNDNAVLSALPARDLAEGRYGTYVYGSDEETDVMLDACKKPAGISYEAFMQDLCPPLPFNYALTIGGSESVRPSAAPLIPKWDEEKWRLHSYAYCRLTELVDSHIGVVLDALRANPALENNTVVIFTSDHGEMQAAHMLEAKTYPYDESTRVPFIISYKAECTQARVDSTHLVSNGLDLLPTICDYAGITTPAACLGRSVRPLVQQDVYNGEWREYVVSEMRKGGTSRMVRTQHYKYFVCPPLTGVTVREMLFDVDKDPGEMENIAGKKENAAILDYHRHLLKLWCERNNDKMFTQYLIPPVNPVSTNFNIPSIHPKNSTMQSGHQKKRFDVRGRAITEGTTSAAGTRISNGERVVSTSRGKIIFRH